MEIKNTVTISLIIFIIVIIGILGYSVLSNPNTSTNNTPVNLSNAGTVIAMNQVATHNTANDCWVIVKNQVYNVTSLIPQHPGGPGAITPFCGKDATIAFENRNGKGPHPQKSQEKLDTVYLVGPLEIK